MSKSKKEIIESLEKVLNELKKKEEKPKTTEKYLEEISEKLSKLLEKNDREDVAPFNYPVYPREILEEPRSNPLKWWEQTSCNNPNSSKMYRKSRTSYVKPYDSEYSGRNSGNY